MSKHKGGYIYILANQPNGVLYIGVTSDIHKRIYQHREGTYEGFSKKYGCKTLVYYEHFESIENAIKREKQLKKFKRAWKVGLIMQGNDTWEDLYPLLTGEIEC